MPKSEAPSSDVLADWLAWLETLSPKEIDLGLERVRAVLAALELPRPRRLVIVGGTNGKGSTVAMLDALYAGQGARVGAYTSPHVLRYNERIRIAGEAAEDAAILAAFREVEAARGGQLLTYFEYGTLAALVAFARARCDVVVLEVGLGGRLDAVNATEPDGVVITNIALDHCDWLGSDLESIAGEKAGIMRKGRPAVFAGSHMPATIAAAAAERGATLLRAGRDFVATPHAGGWRYEGGGVTLDGLRLPSLAGAFQVDNAAGAIALYQALEGADSLAASAVNEALGRATLPGRLQRYGERWLLDVAHNPAAAEVLAGELAARGDEGDEGDEGGTAAVIGVLADKDADGILGPLLPLVDHWIAVTADSPRALPAAELAARLAALGAENVAVAPDIAAALKEAEALPAGRLLVTGSFFVIGPALGVLTAGTDQAP